MSAIATRISREATGSQPAVARIFGVMFWKEVRELAPWSALAGIGLSIGLAFVLYQDGRGYAREGQKGFSIVANDFYLVTVFVIPVMGLLLGFLQFVGETKPDRFAFLVHRPMTRSAMFWAKIIPGLTAYLTVTVAPLAAGILWAKDPYHLTYPFRWDMALPAVADVVAGMTYYAAGVLVARRANARWWGSRLLPIAAAVLASGFNYWSTRFHWAVLADVMATGVLLTAAWGAFVSGGQYFPQPRLAKVGLGVVLAVAVFMMGAMGLGILAACMEPRDLKYQYSNVVFLADGTPARLIAESGRPEHLEDLGGKVIAEISGQDWESRSNLLLKSVGLDPNPDFSLDRGPFRLQERFFTQAFAIGQDIGQDISWFRPAGGDYLVGYDNLNHALVGSIGPEGFAGRKAVPPARFKSPIITLGSAPLIACGDTLYRMGDGYRLEALFTTPDHAAIIQMGKLRVGADHVARAAIVTEEQAYVLAEGAPAKLLASCGHGHNSENRVSVAYLEKSDEFLLVFTPRRLSSAPVDGTRVAVYIKSGDGAERVVKLPKNEFTSNQRRNVFGEYVSALSPPSGVVAVEVLEGLIHPDQFVTGWPVFLGILGRCSLVSLTTVAVIYWLSRRQQWPRGARIIWTVLGLLLGPTGLLMMFCMRPMGALVVCPKCGRRRSVTQPQCGRCGAEFAVPKATGTEIFG